ncbi:MAG: stage II sporulation protein P [Bacillota bacterium]
MRLTDTAALVLLGAMFVAPFIPNVNLGAGIRVDLAGFLVPLGVAAYLIITADQAYEKIRGVTAALITGAAVFAAEQLLPPEPTQEMLLDVDPLWLSGLVAGVVGYLSGRSRRASFIAGVGGVALADMAYAIMAAARGARGAYAALGGGGAFDSTIIAGVLAVALAELVGETREYFARRRGGAPAPEGGQARRAGAGGEAGGEAAGEGAAAGGSVWTASFLGLGISAALVAGSVAAAARVYGPELPEHIGDRIYRMIDETGDPVTASALPMSAGDQWIDADNRLYEVIRVVGDTAVARDLGPVAPVPGDAVTASAAGDTTDAGPGDPGATSAGLLDWLARALGGGEGSDGGRGRVALIIHSHNDESYVPSDGTAITNGAGGIHKVGAALARHLEEHGFRVIHDETLHLPHDRGAYRRSRRTILEHLDQRPAVVIDIHRDAIPDPNFYAGEIDGQGVTRLRAVVGRQNPNRAQNLEFARELKAIADEKYPGFFRGIFNAKNNYNQDLGPRVILFEVGTHTNARESAERAMKYLADVIATYFERHGD